MKFRLPFWTLSLLLAIPASAQFTGQLDQTFNATGFAIRSLHPNFTNGTSMAIQPDGKIVVSATSGNNDFMLMRYNANGTVDAGFGNNGIVQTDFGMIEMATSIALQADGKIVVGGAISTAANTPDILIVRYNANGVLDQTFGTNGKTTVNLGQEEAVWSITVAPDGKIVACGETSNIDSSELMVVRLTTSGMPDVSFDNDGIALAQPGYNTYGRAVKVQADGKIVVAGYRNGFEDMILIRFNTNGSVDAGFGTMGLAAAGFYMLGSQGGAAYSLLIQGDGKIVVGGTATDGFDGSFGLVRFQPNGTLDASFGSSGRKVTNFGTTGNESIATLLQQSDGKIVAVGSGQYTSPSVSYIAMARYKINGTPDSSFDNDGIFTFSIGTQYDIVAGAALQPDGKIVTIGSAFDGVKYDQVVARYQNDPVLDIGNIIPGIKTLSIFPNPANAASVLEYTLQNIETVTIDLISADGKIVGRLMEHQVCNCGLNRVSLASVQQYAAGVYFLYLHTETSVLGYAKLIK